MPMPERGPGGKFVPKTQAAERLQVVPRRQRDPLMIPKKYLKPGFVVRRVVITDNQLDNDARMEEMEELGYRPVRDEAGKLVMRRGAVLMEIPKEAYDARQQAYVEENRKLNRAQADERRKQLRALMAGAPLPPGETEGVVGEGIVDEPTEPLVDDDMVAIAAAKANQPQTQGG